MLKFIVSKAFIQLVKHNGNNRKCSMKNGSKTIAKYSRRINIRPNCTYALSAIAERERATAEKEMAFIRICIPMCQCVFVFNYPLSLSSSKQKENRNENICEHNWRNRRKESTNGFATNKIDDQFNGINISYCSHVVDYYVACYSCILISFVYFYLLLFILTIWWKKEEQIMWENFFNIIWSDCN